MHLSQIWNKIIFISSEERSRFYFLCIRVQFEMTYDKHRFRFVNIKQKNELNHLKQKCSFPPKHAIILIIDQEKPDPQRQ